MRMDRQERGLDDPLYRNLGSKDAGAMACKSGNRFGMLTGYNTFRRKVKCVIGRNRGQNVLAEKAGTAQYDMQRSICPRTERAPDLGLGTNKKTRRSERSSTP